MFDTTYTVLYIQSFIAKFAKALSNDSPQMMDLGMRSRNTTEDQSPWKNSKEQKLSISFNQIQFLWVLWITANLNWSQKCIMD